MIWLLKIAVGLVIGGLIVGLAYELDALEHRPDQTISDLVRAWILTHLSLARVLTALIIAFLVWLCLHFWQVAL